MIFSVLETLVCLNQAIYCYSTVPLIVEILRLKTAKGVSDSLVWLYLNSFMAFVFYFFLLDSPFFYRVSIVIQLVMISALITLRFMFDTFSYKKSLAYTYVINVLLVLAFIPYALMHSYEVGNVMGWLAAGLMLLTRIPQIVKVQRERSVMGFSYGFVLLTAFGSAFEIGIVLFYNLPIQTLLTCSAVFVSCIIFTLQFYFFSWRRSQK